MIKERTRPISTMSRRQKFAMFPSMRSFIAPVFLCLVWVLSTSHASAQSCPVDPDPCNSNGCSSPACPGYDLCTCNPSDPSCGPQCTQQNHPCLDSSECCPGLECNDQICIPPQPPPTGGCPGPPPQCAPDETLACDPPPQGQGWSCRKTTSTIYDCSNVQPPICPAGQSPVCVAQDTYQCLDSGSGSPCDQDACSSSQCTGYDYCTCNPSDPNCSSGGTCYDVCDSNCVNYDVTACGGGGGGGGGGDLCGGGGWWYEPIFGDDGQVIDLQPVCY